MFKFLRSKAKPFYWVIAASFIGFIFLAWGMDYNSGQDGPNSQNRVIGEVNGHSLTVQEYDFRYRDALTRMPPRQRNLLNRTDQFPGVAANPLIMPSWLCSNISLIAAAGEVVDSSENISVRLSRRVQEKNPFTIRLPAI